jgi:hypothetical protein
MNDLGGTMGSWRADASGVHYDDGSSFGDRQASGEWSVRLVRDDVPTAFIEVRCAVTLNAAGRYSPETQIEYLVGTDPDDLPGTEVWADIEYESLHPFDYETPDEAARFARASAGDYIRLAGEFQWDGVTQSLN